MSFTFHFSPQFEESLWQIEYYLYQNEGEARCDKVINSIYAKIEYIVLNPLHFPIYEFPFKSGNFRRAIHFDTYIIVYEISDFHIEFFDIYHGKRNV